MRIDPLILKIYCHLVKAGIMKNDWDSYKNYQDTILAAIQQ